MLVILDIEVLLYLYFSKDKMENTDFSSIEKKTLKNNECLPPRYLGRSKLCVEYYIPDYLFDLKVGSLLSSLSK